MPKIIRLPKAHGRLAVNRPQPEVDDEDLQRAMRRAQDNLLRLQSPEGYWSVS